jgi:Folate-dependent phosphoribosylglycinamide formyltransferase PurN
MHYFAHIFDLCAPVTLNIMKRIAIFASGEGTNAERIINYFQDNSSINVELIISNKLNSGVIDRAKRLGKIAISLTSSDLNCPVVIDI